MEVIESAAGESVALFVETHEVKTSEATNSKNNILVRRIRNPSSFHAFIFSLTKFYLYDNIIKIICQAKKQL